VKLKVLIVEDESIVAMDIASVLEELGHEVCGTAYSGEEALRIAEATFPDVILMDVGLKGEADGITIANQLKQKFRAAIIFLTGYINNETKSRMQSVEPLGVLSKPIDDRAIKEILEKYNQEDKLKK
jgi:CheY-like chemotaxis protein